CSARRASASLRRVAPAATSFGDWPAAPRSLHSVPTRRSSDLRHRRRAPEVGIEGWLRVQGLLAGAVALRGRAEPALEHLQQPGEDRKSTRLNSSHVKISYAVFCLKNKTHPGIRFAARPTHHRR